MTKSNYIALAEANANSIGIMFVWVFFLNLNNYIFFSYLFHYKLTTSRRRRPTAARPSTPRTAAAAVWQSPSPLATPLHLAAPPRRPSAAPLCCSAPTVRHGHYLNHGRNAVTAPARDVDPRRVWRDIDGCM